MIYAGILGAGKGVRMHRQDLPKPFLPLGEKPIINHTLEQFIVNLSVGHIVIVVQEEWLQYTEDMLSKSIPPNKMHSVIAGGENKTESIGRIVRFISETFGIADGDILIAHDAVRPFITQRIINDHIEATKTNGAANTAMKMNDAILVTNNGVTVDSVPSHEHLFAEQTPQSYSLAKLQELLESVEGDGISLANESEFPRLWLQMGYNMSMVRGEYFNMKIINPYDLEVANALLRELKVW